MNNTDNADNTEQDDDETQYLRSLAGGVPICISKDDSAGGLFELFPEYED